MNDPIVVWPPGTFNMSCGNLYLTDCTDNFPYYAENGYIACCLAW